MTRPHLLVVDDEPGIAIAIVHFADEGYEVESVASAEERCNALPLAKLK